MMQKIAIFTAGIIVGCSVLLAVDLYTEPPNKLPTISLLPEERDTVESNADLPEILARISRLTSAIESLAYAARDAQGTTLQDAALKSPDEKRLSESSTPPERVKIAPTPKYERLDTKKMARSGFGWAEVLDESLARRLVECGLTPYDRGVPALLVKASQDLRDARNRRSESLDKLKQRYPQVKTRGSPSYQAYKVESNAICQQNDEEVSKILETFRTSLLQLAGLPSPGK